MTWGHYDTWVVIVGTLSATSCALLGNYLVLRRMSMMGDAISHAVLPGLAIAFLITGSRDSVPMFAGAAIVGVLTAVFTQWVHTFGKLDQNASMGVVFTTLFAIGLLLIVRALDEVHIDAGCVLYGAIEFTPLDTVTVLGFENVPRAAVTLGGVLVVDIVIVILFYKELKISAFDPALATTLGIHANAMLYLLMGLVAMTTVASFESVGSILVIAMLIVPGATAHLLTDRLGAMIAISLVVAALSAGLGHLSATVVPGWFGFPSTITSGMMAVVSGVLLALAVLFSPRYGIISRAWHRLALTMQIVREDVLGLLYRVEELSTQPETCIVSHSLLRETVGGAGLLRAVALAQLRRGGTVDRVDNSYRLTASGRISARRLVRSHRLWETYLFKHLQLPADHVHTSASRLEHVRGMTERVGDTLGHPAQDPHGKPIPDQGEHPSTDR